MDVLYLGHSSFRLTNRKVSVVCDPFDPVVVGLKFPKVSATIVTISHDHKDHNNTTTPKTLSGGKPMVFKDPGEYEVCGVVVTGISSFHDNSEGSERGKNTIFHLMFDGLNIVHLGDLGQSKLTEEQVSQIGQTDILLIPVGGVYTIDSKQAANIVSQLEPKIIIPMHFKIEGLKFELAGVEGFLKEMGAEGVIVQPKLSITKDKLPEEPQVVVLSKS